MRRMRLTFTTGVWAALAFVALAGPLFAEFFLWAGIASCIGLVLIFAARWATAPFRQAAKRPRRREPFFRWP